MQKTAIIAFVALMLSVSAVCADGQGMGGDGQAAAGDGAGMPDIEQMINNADEGMLISPGPGAGAKAQNVEQARDMVQQRQEEMAQEMQGMSEDRQNVYRNQNTVREAVHALLSMEGLVGGIGPQVSAIARNFNNSVQATIKAEEKIQERGAFARFFVGGRADAAEEIEQEVSQNRARIEELKQLKTQIADPAVQAMYQEQIQLTEKEQARLQSLAQNETKSKGILGWIWK